MKTLIVDDVLLIRHLLEKTLSVYGDCDVAENGYNALEMFKHQSQSAPYDLVCLDIMMPEVDGLNVIIQIRDFEKSRNTPPDKRCKIIMISAMSESSYVKKSIALGCDDYLVKPIHPEMLISKLNDLGLTKV